MRCLSLLPLLAFSACAAPPRPLLLSQADATRSAPVVQQAERTAPQAFLAAEDLWQQAQRAYEEEDLQRAELLSEQAISAYQHAVVLARVTRAQARVSAATTAVSQVEQEQALLDLQTAELEATVLDIEARAKVARDALPLPKSEPATPERERARQKAALALLSQARLLCVAARLLDPKAPPKDVPLLAQIHGLERPLATTSPAPIDSARRVRAECLRLLSEVRKPSLRDAPQGFASEALLTELSAAKFGPFRDDRGVVVTLREVFTAARSLSTDASEKLGVLGRVAKAHPQFPLLVVLHGRSSNPKDSAAVLQALRDAGATNLVADSAGSTLPVVPPSEANAAARNERVEIVFVSPTP